MIAFKYSKTQWALLIWLLLIDTLFFIKYGSRVLPNFWYLGGIVSIYICLKLGLYYVFTRSLIFSKSLWYFGVFALMLVSILLFKLIDPLSVHVDRWDVVVNWWKALFSGVYPYHVFSRFEGYCSLLPGIQWLLAPFVAMQEVGYATLFALIACLYFMFHDNERYWFFPWLFVSSTAFWWEIAVRSTLICNTLLVVFVAYVARNFIIKKTVTSGFLQGFVLSSRMVFGLLWAAEWIYDLRNKKWITLALFKWALAVVTGFAVTFLPLFFYADPWEVMSNNGLFHQNKHMPVSWSLLVGGILFFWVWKYAQNRAQVIMAQTVALAFLGILFILLVVLKNGVYTSIFESKADISYLNMSYIYSAYLFYVLLKPNKHLI